MTVREYEYLQRGGVSSSSSHHILTPNDFDALKALLLDPPPDIASAGSDTTEADDEALSRRFYRLRVIRGSEVLQVLNFAGVIETPSGQQIEVLPKIGASAADARETLIRMLRATASIPFLVGSPATLRAISLSLTDVFLSEFLAATAHMIRRGIVPGYERKQSTERFLRGRLLVSQHIRHAVSRADRFSCEFEHIQPDRAENRVLRSALELCVSMNTSEVNRRACRELLFAFDTVSSSKDIRNDLANCVRDRSLSHYGPALEWARLILLRLTPMAAGGKLRARAILFPMEKLFERYAGVALRRHYRGADVTVKDQVSSKTLVVHQSKGYFKLRPDFVLNVSGRSRLVCDAKWKHIDQSDGSTGQKYGISQADMYQLYAYGKKYLPEDGSPRTVCLIYPMSDRFQSPLQRFEFEPAYSLLVLPLDLNSCRVLGAPDVDATDAA